MHSRILSEVTEVLIKAPGINIAITNIYIRICRVTVSSLYIPPWLYNVFVVTVFYREYKRHARKPKKFNIFNKHFQIFTATFGSMAKIQ